VFVTIGRDVVDWECSIDVDGVNSESFESSGHDDGSGIWTVRGMTSDVGMPETSSASVRNEWYRKERIRRTSWSAVKPQITTVGTDGGTDRDCPYNGG